MKPLRDLILIKQDEGAKEEKTKSGLILFKNDFDLYQFGDSEAKLYDTLNKVKPNTGRIIAMGDGCGDWFDEGDSVIFKKNAGQPVSIDGAVLLLIKESDILVTINGRRGLIPAPGYALIKISKDIRDSLFIKKGVRDDGSKYELFVQPPPDKDDEKHSQFFVSAGQIIDVGADIIEYPEAFYNAIALLDYRCDNDDTIIVGYDGEDKLIVVNAATTKHTETRIEYANRKQVKGRDQIVYEKGDYENMSDLLGVIRGDELIAIEPYVFLSHESAIVNKKTKSGIEYIDDEKILTRTVIAASKRSMNYFGFNIGDSVLVDDFDVFDVTYDGRKMHCINDRDILANTKVIDDLSVSINKTHDSAKSPKFG